MLHGRIAEQARIMRLLAGESGALMVRGEAGAGKSALLAFAAEIASDQIVLRASGTPEESHLPYGGLHMLLATTRPRWKHLPAQQRDVLDHLGQVPGIHAAGEPYLPAWNLLRHLAGRGPVLCLIDDAHWLDRESLAVLSFCVRRLAAARVVILLAAEGELPALRGIDELDLPGVDRQAALDIVAERRPGIVPQVRERIVGDARGNPLALCELAAGISPAQVEGGLSPLGLYTGWPGRSRRADQLYGERLRALPERTRFLLLLAATDPAASLPELLAATRAVPAAHSELFTAAGATPADLAPAETAELVEVRQAGLTPRHLLILVAAYQSAPVSARIAAHQALAEVSPERRVWHLAAAVLGPDEEIARELAAIGTSSALERAAELTTDPRPRARRYAAAAVAACDAGQQRRAADLATRATELSAEPSTLASAARVLATVECEIGSPTKAARMLLDSAARIGDDDHAMAIVMIADAIRLFGYSGDEGLAAQIAAAVWAAPAASRAPSRVARSGAQPTWSTPLARSLPTLAKIMAGDPFSGFAAIGELVEHTPALATQQAITATSLGLMAADAGSALRLTNTLVTDCRHQDLMGLLPYALQLQAQALLLSGRKAEALRQATEGLKLARDLGQTHRVGHLSGLVALIAALSGDEKRCRAYAESSLAYCADHDAPASAALATWALGLMELGRGRAGAAVEHLARVVAGPAHHPVVAVHCAADLVDAAVQADLPGAAAEPLALLERWAGDTRQRWVGAVALRCRALVAPDGEAEPLFTGALDLHGPSPASFQRARTELAYGQWLRRIRRRSEARSHLRAACAAFESLGSTPWAERAAAELSATGEASPAEPLPEALRGLTPQERHVVSLAAQGSSNRDIAAQLFLSPRTVGYHLYRAFPKLGITSRTELADLLRQAGTGFGTITPAADMTGHPRPG
ncbi:helix-turn-helix transcriptional regulator [Nonomuraea sp. NEAU-A123]|uniref:helix-turn-helix transcriptional regulator n=1 Tax=Nonomuraea sp. NEAU-A123 TaxID=2839649 RepID=UPI001BE44597|nr:helix-turn-helix transcriptional regulator [Nonomuraea sp. NEAU-A123]MBT2231544.1 AAA family ATPase [Nonomuraea sp. NEAU-A123]